MMRGMYAAISGLQAHQTMLDVTANNLSNVDTIGYKVQRTTFVDQLSQMVRAGIGPSTSGGGANPVQVGLGVQLGSIDNLMGGGSMQSTGNPTDIAIQGDGFLRVAGASDDPPTKFGSVQYTRAGNLTINSEGNLVTRTGLYVLDTSADPGKAINIPKGATGVAISQDGSVSYVDATTNARTVAGVISLATFPNEAGLERAGGSLWNATSSAGKVSTGPPSTPGFGTTISGELEMSNVDMATEFTNMITAERGYQANSRVITTADQMLQTLVQMGG